jgi:ubiquinone/menaquinone biosynthesis C-methylase UbiE
MDYDITTMPDVYDMGRGYAPEVMELWLSRIAAALGRTQFDTILDVGCGTGRYSGPLSDYFSAHVIGVDPSKKMLAAARRKGVGKTDYHVASAESLPVGDASIDLVYLSMVLHHFDDPVAAVGEIFRVLKAGGRVALRCGSAEQIKNYPYVPFFPASAPLLDLTLQSVLRIRSLFEDGGLDLVHQEVVQSPVAPSWNEFAERTSYRADSILVKLSDEEFSEGLEHLRAYAKQHPGRITVIEPVDLFVFQKPAVQKRALIQ